MNDHIEVLRQLLREAVPYLRDAGEPFEDDGGNEPLELSRRIEDALESDAALAAMSERPECVRRQRDELRERMEADLAPLQADFEEWAASIGFCVTGKYAETIDVLCAKSAFKAGYQAGRAAIAQQPEARVGGAVAFNYAMVHRFATENRVDYNALAKLVRECVYTTPPAKVPEGVETLRHIAAIAHDGFLGGLTVEQAMVCIRRLSLAAWDGSGSTKQRKARVTAAMLAAAAAEPKEGV